jgi:hypothetical protein
VSIHKSEISEWGLQQSALSVQPISYFLILLTADR